jgi:hypothetical protein
MDNMNNILAFNPSSIATQKAGDITIPELLARCTQRPTDEYAWQEFVRRFHATIRRSVEKTLCFKTKTGTIPDDLCNDDVIDRIIQMVYYKLIENRCQALKRLDGVMLDSIKAYLVILSINVVREYLQGMKAS